MFAALKRRDKLEANLFGMENRIYTTEVMKQKHKKGFEVALEKYKGWLLEHKMDGVRYYPKPE